MFKSLAWLNRVGWLVCCLTSQQHAIVSQGRICSDKFTCCHTEIEVADQTFYLTQSQYTDTGPTSPSADPLPPGAWQGCHWSANFSVTVMTRPGKIPAHAGFEPWVFCSRGRHFTHSANEVVTQQGKSPVRKVGIAPRSASLKADAFTTGPVDCLVGLVVKASASRAEDPGFESRLRRDFFGVESYQWLKNWHSSGHPARRLA